MRLLACIVCLRAEQNDAGRAFIKRGIVLRMVSLAACLTMYCACLTMHAVHHAYLIMHAMHYIYAAMLAMHCTHSL